MDRVKWTFAKTYAKTAPHEYILKENYPAVFKRLKKKIKDFGVNQPFELFGNKKTYRYYYFREYKYWIIENVLNRDKIKNP